MPKQFFFNETALYRTLSAFFTVLFLYLACFCYFSDSEIWLMTLSEQIFSHDPPHAVYFKSFFHFINKLAILPAQTNVQVYYLSRLGFSVIGLSAAWLQAVIVSHVFAHKQLRAPTFLFLLTASLFFNQAFRIRADILSLSIYSVILLFILQWSQVNLRRLFLLSSLQILLLLTTPKALIWTALLLILAALLRIRSTNKDDHARSTLLFVSILAPLQILLTVFIALIFFKSDSILLRALHSAADFYFKSFHRDLGGADYLQKMDFYYVYRFFLQNWFHSFVFIFWFTQFIYRSLYSSIKNTWVEHLNVLTASLIIFVFLYNQKLPFFLGTFLAPVWAVQFASFYLFAKITARARWVPAAILVGSCVLCFFQYQRNLHANNNREQLQFVQQLEDYKIQNPAVSIYDIIGLLPRDTTYFYFIGPGDVTHREELLREIQLRPPDVYLYTFKNTYYEPLLTPYLEKNYIEYFPGVWWRAQIFHMNQTSLTPFDILSFRGKNYWLLASTKKPVVNSNTFENISSSCLYLDKSKSLTKENDVHWIAVPWELQHFAFVHSELPKEAWKNPFSLFRFDTAF